MAKDKKNTVVAAPTKVEKAAPKVDYRPKSQKALNAIKEKRARDNELKKTHYANHASTPKKTMVNW